MNRIKIMKSILLCEEKLQGFEKMEKWLEGCLRPWAESDWEERWGLRGFLVARLYMLTIKRDICERLGEDEDVVMDEFLACKSMLLGMGEWIEKNRGYGIYCDEEDEDVQLDALLNVNNLLGEDVEELSRRYGSVPLGGYDEELYVEYIVRKMWIEHRISEIYEKTSCLNARLHSHFEDEWLECLIDYGRIMYNGMKKNMDKTN